MQSFFAIPLKKELRTRSVVGVRAFYFIATFGTFPSTIVFTLTKKLDFFRKIWANRVIYRPCDILHRCARTALLPGFVIPIESLPTKFDVDYAIKFDV